MSIGGVLATAIERLLSQLPQFQAILGLVRRAMAWGKVQKAQDVSTGRGERSGSAVFSLDGTLVLMLLSIRPEGLQVVDGLDLLINHSSS